MAEKRTKGFTLVELIVVVAIIAILAALAAPLVNGYIIDAQEKVCLASREILERDITAALVSAEVENGKKLTNLEKTVVVEEEMLAHGATKVNTTHFTGFCPCGGAYAVFPGVNSDTTVACVAPEHTRLWVKGERYEVGEILIANGYALRCLKAHTSGSRSNTRNPTVKSNKGSWEVIGSADGGYMTYNATVRFAHGAIVKYNNNLYSRTNFNLTGGQTPYSKNSSRYWILEGPAPLEEIPGG